MPEANDMERLREFAHTGSETAFAELVRRHVSLVYSVALRHVGSPAHAEEITQAVFIILARRAARLRPGMVLAGWLHTTARLTALSFLRGERRRQFREQEAYMQSIPHDSNPAGPDADWQQLAPLLDAAVARLGKKDRDALVLRFFKNQSIREVADALGMNEPAAQRRILRALEKLRKAFARRGVHSSAAAIAGCVSANSIQVAPTALAKAVTAVALAKGAAASASTLTLIQGALKIMAWTKVKITVVTGAIVLLAAGTATVTVKEIQWHKRLYSWEGPKANFDIFYNAQPQITIVPTKFNAIYPNGDFCCDGSRGAMGIAVPLKEMIQIAYQQDYLHTVVVADLPTNRFDFMAKLVAARQPHKVIQQNENWSVELQNAIVQKFGIRGRLEMRNTDVLVLKPTSAGVHGFQVSHKMPGGLAVKSILAPDQNGARVGNEYHRQPLNTFVAFLQNKIKIPIVDETGLTNDYDFSFSWVQSPNEHAFVLPDVDKLNPLLASELGLELVRTNMPVQMLVVEKAQQ